MEVAHTHRARNRTKRNATFLRSTAISGLLDAGHNDGAWTGNGIVTSQTAATAFRGRTTLGVATASQVLGIATGATGTWQGRTVAGSSILIKYTYLGDTDLDGEMGGDDYFRIDSGFSPQSKGYFAGEIDYNGMIDVDDYFWTDANYSFQGPLL